MTHSAHPFESENNIARAVLHRRLDLGLSQSSLAGIAGTTQARISEVESLSSDSRIGTLSRIARALGCELDMRPVRQIGVPEYVPSDASPARLTGSAT